MCVYKEEYDSQEIFSHTSLDMMQNYRRDFTEKDIRLQVTFV
jgi:hypothetical protein